jgi:hypothetical protein
MHGKISSHGGLKSTVDNYAPLATVLAPDKYYRQRHTFLHIRTGK